MSILSDNSKILLISIVLSVIHIWPICWGMHLCDKPSPHERRFGRIVIGTVFCIDVICAIVAMAMIDISFFFGGF
jgi:hypothetical protein